MRQLIEEGELGDIQCVIVKQGVSAALWGLTHGADVRQFLAKDSDIEFVQGTIIYKDDDWGENRLNVDPGVAAGYVQFAHGIRGYFTSGGAASSR